VDVFTMFLRQSAMQGANGKLRRPHQFNILLL
jgi:hypothetical protein